MLRPYPFHLNHDGMLRRAEGVRRPALGGQYVDVAAEIHAVLVGCPPCALGDVDHAGQYARGDAGGDDQFATLIPHAD